MYPEFDRQCLTNVSWSNITRILRIDSSDERDYYIKEVASQNWSYRQLELNIRSGYYYRLLSSQESNKVKQGNQLPSKISAKELVKDPYVLEFLDLPEGIEGKESVLETALKKSANFCE